MGKRARRACFMEHARIHIYSSIFRRFSLFIHLYATIKLKVLVFDARVRSFGCLFSVCVFSKWQARRHLVIVFLTMKIFAN